MLGCDKRGLRGRQELTVKPKNSQSGVRKATGSLNPGKRCRDRDLVSASQNQVLCRQVGISRGDRSSSPRFQQRHHRHQRQRPNSHDRPQRTGQDSDRYPSNRSYWSTWIGKPDAATDRHHRSNQGTAQIHSQHLGHTFLFAATTVRCAYPRWNTCASANETCTNTYWLFGLPAAGVTAHPEIVLPARPRCVESEAVSLPSANNFPNHPHPTVSDLAFRQRLAYGG